MLSRLVGGALILAIMAGCDSGTDVDASPEKYAIEVIASPGVKVVLSPVRDRYSAGQLISYHLELEIGFENPYVDLDGAPAPISGTLEVTSDRRITATADAVLVPTDREASLALNLRALIEAADPVQAYQQLLVQLESAVEESGWEAALRAHNIASALAIDPVRDAEKYHEALVRIGDSLADAPGSHAGAAPVAQPQGANDGVDFRYVNGIWVSDKEASLALPVLQSHILNTSGYADRLAYPLKIEYNPSQKNADASLMAAWLCLNGLAIQYSVRIVSAARRVGDCVNLVPYVGHSTDLSEAALQIANLSLGGIPSVADYFASELADTLDSIVSRGQRVVLIAHSQGNLMAAEAFSILRSRKSAATECIGLVSIAPPQRVLPLASGSVSSLIIDDRNAVDVLLSVSRALTAGTSLFGVPGVANAISVEYNNAVSSSGFLTRFFLGAFSPFFVGTRLHGIVDSYIGSPGSARETIRAAVVEQVNRVKASCPLRPVAVASVEVSGPTELTVGGSAQLTAVARDGAGQVIPGVAFSWSSSKPTVVEVDSGGLAMAKGPGTSIIFAAAGGVMGSATITVPGPAGGSGNGGSIANGETREGSISPGGNVELWTFTASAGAYIAAGMGESTAGSDLFPYLRLVSPSGKLLDQDWSSGGAHVQGNAPETGTYTLIAASNDWGLSGAGDYRISLAVSGGGVVVSLGDQGGPLGNGATENAFLHAGELDVWTFTASAGAYIAAGMGESTAGSDLFPYLRLVSPSGKLLDQDWSSGGAHVQGNAPETGTYTLIAASNDWGLSGAGDYRISLAVSGGGGSAFIQQRRGWTAN